LSKQTTAKEPLELLQGTRFYLTGTEQEQALLRIFLQQLIQLQALRLKSALTLELRLVEPETRSLVKYQLRRLALPSRSDVPPQV
jgi:hypothetical protein